MTETIAAIENQINELQERIKLLEQKKQQLIDNNEHKNQQVTIGRNINNSNYNTPEHVVLFDESDESICSIDCEPNSFEIQRQSQIQNLNKLFAICVSPNTQKSRECRMFL